MSDREPRFRRLVWPLSALLAALVLTAAAYARVLDGEFQYDDGQTVVHRLAVKDLGGFLRDDLVRGFLDCARPATDLTFALNYAVGGLVPWNFHLTSIVLHLGVSVLVWLFGRSVLRLAGAARAEWVAVAVAGVFALHPQQSEAVAYVSQRSEVLASGFYVATLLLLLAAERRGLNPRGAPFLAGAVATFLLALGSKAIAVTLPLAWLLLVAVVPAPERRAALLTWRTRSLALLPFAALDGLFVSRQLVKLGGASAGFDVPGLPVPAYFLTELRVIAVYLRLLVWPAGQNVDWDFRVSTTVADVAVVLAGLLLLGLAAGAAALALAARRRSTEDAAAARVAAFGVAWFFLLLSVTSSFVPLADVIFEHRVYLASWGAIVAPAVLLERLLSRASAPSPRLAAFSLVALWSALAITLYRRNAVWETPLALWSDAVSKSPAKPGARMNLGFALGELQRTDEAVVEYRKAVELAVARGDRALEMLSLRNLGAELVHSRRTDEAVEVLERAAALDPNHPGPPTALAAAFGAKGDYRRARAYALRAVLLDPSRNGAWSVLGEVQLEEGDLAGARTSLERAVALDPDAGAGRYDLGRVLERQGDREGACAAWRRALDGRLEPSMRADLDRLRAHAECGR